jgi:uncharacterized LabA/DUF88 family protein
MRTWVYVDGFNLYYRCLKGTTFKWLDLKVFCQLHLESSNVIERIKYYTADVSAKIDPTSPARQRTYLNALMTLPEIEIIKGNFLFGEKTAVLVDPRHIRLLGTDRVRVHKVEEKGSDVNIAAHLVLDSCRNVFDVAVIISNDTDLVEPLRIATQELGKTVGLICPAPKAHTSLVRYASFVRHVSKPRLHQAQFPPAVYASDGRVFQKPQGW